MRKNMVQKKVIIASHQHPEKGNVYKVSFFLFGQCILEELFVMQEVAEEIGNAYLAKTYDQWDRNINWTLH